MTEPTADATGPARRIGVVGGGQLARMMAGPAAELGVSLAVLAEKPDDAAAQVVPDAPLGSHLDAAAVTALAERTDVLTFDHEHVPPETLRALARAGHIVAPDADALQYAQDKAWMRGRMAALGVPQPRFSVLMDLTDPDARPTAGELDAFLGQVGGEAVLKTSRGGYDGKGVRVVRSSEDAADWLADDTLLGDMPLVAEEKVPFTRELAALVARSTTGEMRSWPVAETVQKFGTCFEVTAPAPGLSAERQAGIQALAERIAEELDVTGVLAVELFDLAPVGEEPDPEGRAGALGVEVNELAMRPHNSGHWTQDGAVTDQFEQHLRAVAGWPLGATAPTAPWTVMVNLLGGSETDLVVSAQRALAADPGVRLHLYGKSVRPGRKLGHVTVTGTDLDEVRARARRAERLVVDGIDPEDPQTTVQEDR
jgi:5-(carboxyamino)imidazole ribonucleotide synthase